MNALPEWLKIMIMSGVAIIAITQLLPRLLGHIIWMAEKLAPNNAEMRIQIVCVYTLILMLIVMIIVFILGMLGVIS